MCPICSCNCMDVCVLPWLMITTLIIGVHHLWLTNVFAYQIILCVCLTTRNNVPWFFNLLCMLLFKYACIHWCFLNHFPFVLSTSCSLRGCKISNKGACAIATALRVNKSLQCLKWVQLFMFYLLRGVHWYMWEANVPEKLIQQRTGHRSLEALRSYERTSITQQRAVSAVLASSEDIDYQSEVSNKSQILPVSRPSWLIRPPISDTSAATRGELFGKAFQSCHNCTISVNVNYNK